MNPLQHHRSCGQQDHQQGAALVVSLVLLVIVTLLGLAAIRGITQEERMANHSLDRSLAFQASEAALREIEQLVEANKPTPAAGCSKVANLMSCAPPAAGDTPRWLDSTFASWTALALPVGSGNLAVTPQYFVEYLGGNFECLPGEGTSSGITCKRYRITARSHDGTSSRSSVMLQSIYATD
ncbi:PilX N-terminal domain-containing pilus assembly protein [Rhodoferax sp. BLA1]|uniref:pilus assembly PilX family protein n=1 Tax=Rhodoferax sp. BLA1 TaxID=2576062 RepID=UPI0015D2516D|nr:PilX N-terminal domain-containing pilus assembly protein [Rhodoferax sp. BLA1]